LLLVGTDKKFVGAVHTVDLCDPHGRKAAT
jgi:hypothetical protein